MTLTCKVMAIGDALAVVWTERSGISPVQLDFNHPEGSLVR